MNQIVKRLVWTGAFVAAYFGARALIAKYRARSSEVATARGTDSVLKKISTDAAKDYAALPHGEAVIKAATAVGNEYIRTPTTPEKQAQAAADVFWGYYFVNTRARLNYCKTRGVDLASFVAEFTRANARELTQATSLYASVGRSEDQVYDTIKATLDSLANADMRDAAQQAKATPEEMCQRIEANAHTVAQAMMFSQKQPVAEQALMARRR